MAEKRSIGQFNTPNAEKERSIEQNIEAEKSRSVRLDQLLVQLGYAQSRERAKTLIKAGHVLVDGEPITKVATQCVPDAAIEVTVKDISWVSRAGLKLEKALEMWPIEVSMRYVLMWGLQQVALRRYYCTEEQKRYTPSMSGTTNSRNECAMIRA